MSSSHAFRILLFHNCFLILLGWAEQGAGGAALPGCIPTPSGRGARLKNAQRDCRPCCCIYTAAYACTWAYI